MVVPLYLAECLGAAHRGKGTGIFQWLLTLGIVAAAIIGLYFSNRVDEVAKLGDAAKLFAFKDTAWRSIFWVSLPPGILFVIGSFMVAESPRWLFRRGKTEAARAALLRSRTAEQAEIELKEMEETAAAEKNKTSTTGEKIKESLLRRKYVIPFVLACIILACNQAHRRQFHHRLQRDHSDSSRLGRPASPFGLCHSHAGKFPDDHRGRHARWIAKGASFCSRSAASALSFRSFASAVCFAKLKNCAWIARVPSKQWLPAIKRSRSRSTKPRPAIFSQAEQSAANRFRLIVIYSYGDFRAATAVARSEDATAKPVEITRRTVFRPTES